MFGTLFHVRVVVLSLLLFGIHGVSQSVRHQGDLGNWMSQYWNTVGPQTLLQLTLPGSHNSGSYAGALSADALCSSDYRYSAYLRDSSTGPTPFSQEEFDRRMIPWNINHFLPMSEQLTQDGVRVFHLKVCNMGRVHDGILDLDSVSYQHRGYTTQETVASTISMLKAFLADHPHEVVVLSFNNLDNFSEVDILGFATAIVQAVGVCCLIDRHDLETKTVAELVAASKRLLIFLAGSPAVAAKMPPGIVPSVDSLVEHWNDGAMAGGDLEASKAWLVKDFQAGAKQPNKFFVLQANPNNRVTSMFAAINSGKGPQSNEAFLESFLRQLDNLVSDAAASTPEVRINAINSDFLNISRPFNIALRLMGIKISA